MNLIKHLQARAIQHPERVALVDAHGELSYGDLYRRVCAGSAKLQHDGHSVGAKALILMPVGVEMYVALLSVLHAGMSVVLLDPSRNRETISQSLQRVKPDCCIAVAKAQILRLLNQSVREIPQHYCPSKWVLAAKSWPSSMSGFSEPVEVDVDHPALITFTSGSTGIPKVACRTHAFLLAQHRALAASLDHEEGEIDLITLPVFAIANLASGLSSVIADTDLRVPGNVDGRAVLTQCEQWEVSRCAASPAFFQSLLESNSLYSFDAIYTGGAPVYPHLLEQLQTKLPNTRVVTVYGSTEAEPISHCEWAEVDVSNRSQMMLGKGLLVGRPVNDVTLKLIEVQQGKVLQELDVAAFKKLSVAQGLIGEVVVTGEHVLKGYLNGVGDAETKFSVEGEVWHRTGDAAWLGDDGQLWLVGRCKAAVKSNDGHVVYPFGVECSALKWMGVDACALVKHKGRITLCYQGDLGGDDKETLLQELKQLHVEALQPLETIPLDKRHNAKVDYPQLGKVLGDL